MGELFELDTAPQRPLRVLVVTESFLPQVNGVTNSVTRALDHFSKRGIQATVIAPSGPDNYRGFTIERVRSVGMPMYRDFPVGMATKGHLRRMMQRFRPDVVHLASPALLGHQAGSAARNLGIPVVAIYQTDLIGFAERYPVPGAVGLMRKLTTKVHHHADRNLAPSSASAAQLEDLDCQNIRIWGRGVDTGIFRPDRRTDELRNEVGSELRQSRGAGRNETVLVGYVGRLAAEKELGVLKCLEEIPRVKLVIVGGGPEEKRLREELPGAAFLGVRRGEELGRIVASLDIFVHTGRKETFCQSAQEALASAVPVVAPRAGGLLDLVRHLDNGLLYTPGASDELQRCVRALVEDPQMRAGYARSALAGIKDRSWEGINDQLLGHYEDVIHERNDKTMRAAG